MYWNDSHWIWQSRIWLASQYYSSVPLWTGRIIAVGSKSFDVRMFFFCVRASVADCIHAVGIDMDILFCSVRKMKYGKFVGGTFWSFVSKFEFYMFKYIIGKVASCVFFFGTWMTNDLVLLELNFMSQDSFEDFS